MTTKGRKLAFALSLVALAGCSHRYGSKEEAELASYQFKTEGKTVIVMEKATEKQENEYAEKSNRLAAQAKEKNCELAKRVHPTEKFFNRNSPAIAKYEKARRQHQKLCDNPAPFISRADVFEKLFKSSMKNTRWCWEEEQIRQYVCSEKNVRTKKGEKISREEWDSKKASYRYFRY